MCDLNANSYVHDLACGVGTAAFFISDRYGSRIRGIDITEGLIAIADRDLAESGAKGDIRFRVPPERACKELVEKRCNDLIPGTVTSDERDSFFRSKRLTDEATLEYPVE